MSGYGCNMINYLFIDYIIKCYVPELIKLIEDGEKKVNIRLFQESMLHESTKLNEDDKSYERLEYLGDAIFHMIITEYFNKRYEDEAEGFLTRLRIQIERGDSMVELTKKLELGQFIQIYNTNIDDHILEDVFEAFVGAFYLNFGMYYTRIFIVRLIEAEKDLAELISHDDNYKDLLLRYFHQAWGEFPVYDKKVFNGKFISIVRNPSQVIIGKGQASSKRKAEQLASKDALINLKVIVNGNVDQNWLNKIDKIEKEKKIKVDKNAMSVFNPNNKLITRNIVRQLLEDYEVSYPKNLPTRKSNIDIKLFQEAMTHRSYLVRTKLSDKDKIAAKTSIPLQKKSNERLQFLGDSVIHFIIGEYLYNKYEYSDEGFLTRLRCKLENKESLFFLAKKTGIYYYLLISQNIEALHGRNNINIISKGLNAFMGVLYLEMGLGIARKYFLEVIRFELDISKIIESETNYKDLILQLYNSNHWGKPDYRIIKEEGPDHIKMFTMGLYLNNELMGVGTASSKRKAEQIASEKAYKRCQNE